MKNQNFFNQRKQETDIIGRLAGLNFTQVELLDIHMDIKVEIVEACEDFIKDFPILKEVGIKLKAVSETVIGKETIAESELTIVDGKLVGTICLNYDEFTNPEFKNNLKRSKHTHFFAGTDVRGVIIHELSHLLHYWLDIIFCKVNFLVKLSERQVLLLHNRLDGFKTTKKIQTKILQKNDLSKEQMSLVLALSEYGTRNPNEFIAEAMSEYYTTTQPRAIAKSIHYYMQKLFSNKSFIRLKLFIYFFI